jgi:hypothetical protein
LNSPLPSFGLTLLIAVEPYPVLVLPTVSLGISLTNNTEKCVLKSIKSDSRISRDIRFEFLMGFKGLKKTLCE